MRNDGFIERFDELTEAVRTHGANMYRRDNVHRTAGVSNVSRFWFVLSKAFKEHQSWFLISPHNKRVLYFPFAWYLEKGMKIWNRTSGAVYTIQDVRPRVLNLPFGESHKVTAVYISGNNPPDKHHRLRFDSENYVVLRPATYRSMADNTNFEYSPNTEEYGAWKNVITYYLTRREAGSTDKNPFGRHRERRPRHRESWVADEFRDVSLDFSGQVFDNIAQFDCWTKDTTEADILVDYFEQFMSLWTGVIEYNGIERIWFWGRGMDAVESRWRNDITSRSLQYFFRTEDVFVRAEYLLKAMDVAVRVDTGTATATGIAQVSPTGVMNIEIQE